MNLTQRQEQILNFMRLFQEREGFPPSLREICQELGLVSPGSLIKHIRSLEAQGSIRGMPGKKRAWKVVSIKSAIASSIPVLGHIAAGSPILAQGSNDDDLPINPNFFGSPEAFALRVKGDSMIDAHIQDGDLAIIRPQEDAENGDIVAVMIDDIEAEATLKILRIYKELIELRPANELYEPLIFRRMDRSKIRILGKLIGVIRPKL